MAKKKKISRKELLNKPDEFINISTKIFNFVSQYQAQIIFGLIIIIVLIVSAAGMRFYINKAEKEASNLLSMIMSKYKIVHDRGGPEAAYQAVEEDVQKLLAEYSNREGGKLARVLFADICYRADKTDKAIELYTMALNTFNNKSAIKYFVLNGLGYCYEKKSDNKKAVMYFQMVVDGHDNAMKGEALFNLGRIYAEMGDREKSQAAFKKVLSDYSDSIFAELVKERISG